MNRSLYTGGVGMITQMKSMDVISNNIANVNTTGYKADGVATRSFDEELMLRINDQKTLGNFTPNMRPQQVGHMNMGVTIDENYTNFSNGGLQRTEGTLDLAIDGDGFFTVQKIDKNGEAVEMYTRDGSFTVDNENRLMTKDGYFVVGENGPITLGKGVPVIDKDGAILEDGAVLDQIKVVTVENKDYLRKYGDNLYSKLDGIDTIKANAMVRQGYVESSNANPAKEMVNLINISRLYEANQKVVTTSDTLMGKAANDIARRV